MTSLLKIIYCLAFFAVCFFFSLGMLIPGASRAEEDSGSIPTFADENGINSSFGDEFESWFSKNFAYRSETVSLFSTLRESIFCTGNDQVTVGKNGFLFFNESLKSYTGSDPMSDDEITAAADSLAAISKYAVDRGAEFLFVCAPNKATVYPEMLPDRFSPTEQFDLDRLYNALDERNVPYIDLRPSLLEAKGAGLLYHRRDTHWNGFGASYAFKAIADKAGIGTLEFCEFCASDSFEGDLDRLLYPGEVKYDSDLVPELTGRYVFTTAYSSPMDLSISAKGGGELKVLMFRDSFANALIPYFASSCKETTFERANPYRLELLDEKGADVVIVEIAERNLADLISSDDRLS